MKTQFNMEKPTIVTEDLKPQETVTCKSSERQKSYVKVIVISVAAVCVTITVVAGFLFAFKFQTQSTNEIIKRTLEARGLQETIEENKSENTKLYTVHNPEGTQQVLYDFNRKLKLVKASDRCFVYAMNSTEKDVEDMTTDESYVYKFDKQPVHDKSFLSKTGQELCEQQHVYWAFPNCDDRNITRTDDKGIVKRSTAIYTCYNCCITSCGWRVCSCYVQLVRVCGTVSCTCNFYYATVC